MKITAVKLYTLENLARPSRVLKLVPVPNLRRTILRQMAMQS